MMVWGNGPTGQIRSVVDRLVVYDDSDNAVFVVLHIADNTIFCAKPTEKGFKEAMELVGIHKLPKVEIIQKL